MSLLKKKSEDLLGSLSLGSTSKDIDVNDKERKKGTDSSDLASQDKEIAMGGHQVNHENKSAVEGLEESVIVLNRDYEGLLETIKTVAANSNQPVQELLNLIDTSVFEAFSKNEKKVSIDNPILEHIANEVLSDLLFEATPVSMDDISDKEKDILMKVISALNSGSVSNYQPLDLFKGIHGTIAVLGMQNSMRGSLRLDVKTLSALSKVKGMRWIEFNGSQVSVGF